MKAQPRMFRLSTVFLAAISTCGAASAEESDAYTELTRPASTISAGAGYWSNARPHQGMYDGMRNKGAYGGLDFNLVQRDDEKGDWLLLRTTNLFLDTREMRVDYLRQGRGGGFFEYVRTPYDNPYTINTPLQGIGSNRVTMGTTLGASPSREVELGTVRELFRLGGFRSLVPGLEFKVDFKNEDKTGTRMTGWGSAPQFSAETIDSTIRQLDTILQYTGGNLQISGGYAGSWYDNRNTQTLQTLSGVSGGTSASFASVTPLSQPLSNQAHQVFMNGGYGFGPTTRATFKLSYSQATQDERIPSYDLTSANAPYAYAPSHLDGKVFTTLAQLGLTSRPTSKLTLTGSLRYYDVNDQTPLAGYVGNSSTGVASVYNTPYSYTKNTGKLEANYRLPLSLSLTGGVDYSGQQRSTPVAGTVYVPFRETLNEITYRTELRRSMGENIAGSLAYFYSERDGSNYSAADGTSPYSNQINPIHISDRKRNKWRAKLDWDALEQLTLQFRVDHISDDYPQGDRFYGASSGSGQVYAVDASYAINDNWNLSSWYARDASGTKASGFREASGGAANAVRETDLKERGDSFGFNLNARLAPKIDTSFGFDLFNNTSRFDQTLNLSGTGTTYPTGVSGPLPDVTSKLMRFKLISRYTLDRSSAIRFDLIYERWQSNDWSWTLADGSDFSYASGTQTCTGCSTTSPNLIDGTTITQKDKQTSAFIGIHYIYTFR
ncbi:MtrB/PioB family decaheme-associated outer membrane protein [Uliginosibacterium aquaticum]|uniref:MtrB/PioB family decaheme-associated outer membrane protein n=1 Tax=Uliginosibacterium aquaticum TaxID=2731212 RepID=A0ABX2IL16_9RHOO|nr:MtrB/PioB family decaheme-associated outer membrane protein [Uliginosibacterium aquaticum]NSL55722.1 MtrB/PioB family decaheme-associated outer membrane protein [Uliginosibacterium aquaticum]